MSSVKTAVLVCAILALCKSSAATPLNSSHLRRSMFAASSCASRLNTCNTDKAAFAAKLHSCSGQQVKCGKGLATAQSRIAKLSPSASRLSTCNKSRAALAATLAAKTATLKSANTAALTRQRSASKRATIARSAAVGAAADGDSDYAASLAARDAQIRYLEQQLAAMQGKLSSTEAELEDAYSQLAGAAGELYATGEQGTKTEDALYDCNIGAIAQQTQLVTCRTQLESVHIEEQACNLSLTDALQTMDGNEADLTLLRNDAAEAQLLLEDCHHSVLRLTTDKDACDHARGDCLAAQSFLRQQLDATSDQLAYCMRGS